MNSLNSQDKSIDINTNLDAAQLLELMRKGSDSKLVYRFGKNGIKFRVLTASEESKIVYDAKLRAKEQQRDKSDLAEYEQIKSLCIMQGVLLMSTTIDGMPNFTMDVIKSMSANELEYFYDQYTSLSKVVDPEFEKMDEEEIKRIVQSVKKKTSTEKDYFTWQLAEIGKFFLKDIVANLPEDSELG